MFSSPGAELPSTFLREPRLPGLAGSGAKRDSVCISQAQSAGGLYGHSSRFTDGRKLRSAVCVCSLGEVSMSTGRGLCAQECGASVLIVLTSSLCRRTPHLIPRGILFFKRGTQRYYFPVDFSSS